MQIILPEKVKFIIDTLSQNGFEAFAVGGCVRDSILNKKPKDWDITTNASPEEVKALFKRTVDTGIAHGTVTVMLDKDGFEVTTYRIDGKYEDNRHPSEVIFTRKLEDDLLRRDFTINAMAYNDTIGLVDLFGGREDLKYGLIRAVGNPTQRFSEDALRILRGVRFASVLGFTIEDDTAAAMKLLSQSLKNISAERIREELLKLIMGNHPEKLHLAYQYGITEVVFPEWNAMEETKQENRHHIYNCADHTIMAVRAVNALLEMTASDGLEAFAGLSAKNREKLEFICRPLEGSNEPIDDKKLCQTLFIATLLHDIAKPSTKTFSEDGEAHFYGHQKRSVDMAKDIMLRLKFDNESIHDAGLLIGHHDDRYKYRWDTKLSSARRLANKVSVKLLWPLLLLQAADSLAQSSDYFDESFNTMEKMRQLIDEMLVERECFSLKDLAISGKDLINLGIKPGPEMGEILNSLLEQVIENPKLNESDILISLAKSKL